MKIKNVSNHHPGWDFSWRQSLFLKAAKGLCHFRNFWSTTSSTQGWDVFWRSVTPWQAAQVNTAMLHSSKPPGWGFSNLNTKFRCIGWVCCASSDLLQVSCISGDVSQLWFGNVFSTSLRVMYVDFWRFFLDHFDVLIRQIAWHIQKSKAQHRHSCLEQITKQITKEYPIIHNLCRLARHPCSFPMLPRRSPISYPCELGNTKHWQCFHVLSNKISDECQWNISELQNEGVQIPWIPFI